MRVCTCVGQSFLIRRIALSSHHVREYYQMPQSVSEQLVYLRNSSPHASLTRVDQMSFDTRAVGEVSLHYRRRQITLTVSVGYVNRVEEIHYNVLQVSGSEVEGGLRGQRGTGVLNEKLIIVIYCSLAL